MTERLDQAYLQWLMQNIGITHHTGRKTRDILENLFRTRFEWFVEFDRNRAADGMALRREYAFDHNQGNVEFEDEWFDMDCSMLEMLVGLSKRMSIQTDISPSRCFWHIMRNMGLDSNSSLTSVERASEKVVSRSYNRDGSGGGMFPLEDPDKDQRQVELLYQMYAYILENEF